VSPVKYGLGFYIPEDDNLHGHCRENLKSYIALTGCALYWRRNVSPVKYELGSYIPEDDILLYICSVLTIITGKNGAEFAISTYCSKCTLSSIVAHAHDHDLPLSPPAEAL
jgi:hypothetical protein